MTIRILADREPYASYAARFGESLDDKGPPGPFVVLVGPGPVDGPGTDILAMPVEDFLALPASDRAGEAVIAYGDAASMDAAFEKGCADYLREPWPLHELLVRAGRIQNPRVSLGGTELSLVKDRLSAAGAASIELTEAERRLVRLLMKNAGLLVTREAICYSLYGDKAIGARAIDNHVCSLRKKMEQVHKGSGKALVAIRGMGYRLTSISCG
jgi:DNA-binding winged helix-turn-helix (wHTH) protein